MRKLTAVRFRPRNPAAPVTSDVIFPPRMQGAAPYAREDRPTHRFNLRLRTCVTRAGRDPREQGGIVGVTRWPRSPTRLHPQFMDGHQQSGIQESG
jgi:hypothetical protein